jgi:hypothetical protein
MGCGCGSTRTAVPMADPPPRGNPVYGSSLLTRSVHVGPASHPATDQAGVTFGPDNLLGTVQRLRAAVLSSNVLAFARPIPSRKGGEKGLAGSLIVQATSAVPIVYTPGYQGQLPLDQQPMLAKPYPWKGGS